MLIRRLRQPGSGRPVLMTRMIALLVVVGLLAVSAPLFVWIIRAVIGIVLWVVSLL